MSELMVQVDGLSVTYRRANGVVEALRGLSFSVARGQTCAVIGPSGCGKTTLLYVLGGLLPSTEGRVLVAGEPVRGPRNGTAMILQDYGLLPWKTVWENVILGLVIRRAPRYRWQERVEGILRELDLWEFRHHFPAQLSGGQRQRVAIGRALALDADLLLMDEPFSSLDALTREGLQDSLLEMWLRRRPTLVLVTHSIEEAVFLGQQILVLSRRPGRVLQVVPNPGVGAPAYRHQAAFHQTTSLLREVLDRA